MVLCYMRGELTKELTDYLRKAHRLPFRPIRCDLTSVSDKIFSDLKTQIPKPPPLRERSRQDWMSDGTWETMDTRVTARREGDHITVWKLSR